MARGKGRKNESVGKARVNRDRGMQRADGGRTGGPRERNDEKRRSTTRAAAKKAKVLPAGRVAPPGGKRIGGKAGGKSGAGKKAMSATE